VRRAADITRGSVRRLLVLVSWVAVLVALAAITVFAIGPRTGKYRTLTVLSGSMRPTFDPGDSIIVTPVPLDDIKVGDVITYHIPVDDGRVVSHRIVSLKRTSETNPVVITKGDANATHDPWRAQLQGSTAWVMQGRVPKAGYVLRTLRDTWLQRISFGALELFAALALWRVWSPRDEDGGDDTCFDADDQASHGQAA
jgi:signal peptidase